MFERTDPKTLKTWLILAAFVYFIWPFDLLPDFLGLPGRIDDVALIGWLAWFYRNHMAQRRSTARSEEPPHHSNGTGANDNATRPPKGNERFDARKVLGVSGEASREEIRAAYRERMKEYHPDKVAHLGEDLQKLALEKSQQIQRAYRELNG